MKKNYFVLSIIIILCACLLGCQGSYYEETEFLVDGIESQINETEESIVIEDDLTEDAIEVATNLIDAYVVDYENAQALEQALNDGKDVVGKTVQFLVNDYVPESALGINCWAGEHLNFISEFELDVIAGDLIIGRIIEKPTKVMFYSWKIPFEFIAKTEYSTEENSSFVEIEETSVKIENTTNSNQVIVPESSFSWYHNKVDDVIKSLNDAGFFNIEKQAIYDIDHTSVWDSASLYWVETVVINGKEDFEAGDSFDKDSLIMISYHAYEKDDPEIIFNGYTVGQLFDDLESNPMRAEDKHLNEYVEVQGIITEISKHGNYVLICDVNDYFGFEYIYCSMDSDELKDEIYNLSKGDVVKIKGKIDVVNVIYEYTIETYAIENN